jgi:hypothetical protein
MRFSQDINLKPLTSELKPDRSGIVHGGKQRFSTENAPQIGGGKCAALFHQPPGGIGTRTTMHIPVRSHAHIA